MLNAVRKAPTAQRGAQTLQCWCFLSVKDTHSCVCPRGAHCGRFSGSPDETSDIVSSAHSQSRRFVLHAVTAASSGDVTVSQVWTQQETDVT